MWPTTDLPWVCGPSKKQAKDHPEQEILKVPSDPTGRDLGKASWSDIALSFCNSSYFITSNIFPFGITETRRKTHFSTSMDPISPYRGWTKILPHFETLVETIACWYLHTLGALGPHFFRGLWGLKTRIGAPRGFSGAKWILSAHSISP